jgi:protein-L-isoaspartate(D-aspartate) O-methyltransferase
MKVLELGTGSGYQAAVLAQITPWVFTIEIKEPLAKRARRTLDKLGYKSVQSRHGDGYYGWPKEAPFDAIIVTAAAPHVPPPLVQQLKPGGRMIIPVGPPMRVQDLRLITKDEKGRVKSKSLYAVRFVPLTGSLGKKAD